ncbi:MAG: hypothetical protein A2Y73_05810, partial [Chloroflexi bacterium RBG_13_56_8]
MPTFPYRRFYDAIAWLYGPAMRAIPIWSAYTRRALSYLPTEGNILEIGHGPGLLLEELANRYALVAGLDLSSGMIQQAKRRLQRANLPVCLAQGDAVAIPYRTDCFDAVVTTFAFSAVPDANSTMREMARVLRPGGVLALVDAGFPSNGNVMGTLLARTWALFGDFMRDEAELMRHAGLRVIERQEFGAFDGMRLVVGKKPP